MTRAGRENIGESIDHRKLHVVIHNQHSRENPLLRKAPHCFLYRRNEIFSDQGIHPSFPGLPPSTHSISFSVHIDDSESEVKQNRCILKPIWLTLRQTHLNPRIHPLYSNHFYFFDMVRIVSFIAVSGTFNSLFRVLCIFPSRYLFAIGLSPGI